jgi:hypothetical protein
LFDEKIIVVSVYPSMASSTGAFVLVTLSPNGSYHRTNFCWNYSNFLQSISKIFLKDRSEKLSWIDQISTVGNHVFFRSCKYEKFYRSRKSLIRKIKRIRFFSYLENDLPFQPIGQIPTSNPECPKKSKLPWKDDLEV